MDAPEQLDTSLGTPDELAAYLLRQCQADRQRAESNVGLVQYFGFQEEPFGLAPDPRYVYLGHTHEEALATLEHGLSTNRGFTALIAPAGIGKTTLLFRFLENTRNVARNVFLFDIDAHCEPQEFVAHVLRKIGIPPAQTSSEMNEQFSGAILKESRQGRGFVLVIDEAQNLSEAVLERMRLLTNFETAPGKMIHIILSGQPQLSGYLLQPSLELLRQRISTICRVEALSPEEIVPYIQYRVKQAGYSGPPLFTEAALELIMDATCGIPRAINNLCSNALSLCHVLNSKQVDTSMVAKAIADLRLTPESRESISAADDDADGEATQGNHFERTRDLPSTLMPATSGGMMLRVLAVALVMVVGLYGLLRIAKVQTPQPHATGGNSSANLNVPTTTSSVNSVAAPPTTSSANSMDAQPVSAADQAEPAHAQALQASEPPSPPKQSAPIRPSQARAMPKQASKAVTANTANHKPNSASASKDGAPAAPLTVQIATFAHPQDSEALVSALTQRGYKVTALPDPADKAIHVRIGPFSNLDEASHMRDKLLRDGYNAIIQP